MYKSKGKMVFLSGSSMCSAISLNHKDASCQICKSLTERHMIDM